MDDVLAGEGLVSQEVLVKEAREGMGERGVRKGDGHVWVGGRCLFRVIAVHTAPPPRVPPPLATPFPPPHLPVFWLDAELIHRVVAVHVACRLEGHDVAVGGEDLARHGASILTL